MIKRHLFVIILLSLPLSLSANYPWVSYKRTPWCRKSVGQKMVYYFGELVVDAVRLNINLFSVDSAKIITSFTPFYLSARWIDERIQSNFYDPSCHKNVNQLPDKCHQTAQHGVAVPMIGLSGLALYGWTEDLRQTGRMIAIGLPFVHSGKDVIKKLRFKCCLRPWHQDFSSKKRSSGGFPSGHMANVSYMTTLMWMRHGPKWGIPLSLFSSLVFADFLNCNRHYLSQLIAGVGLGVLFAFAANKVVERKLSERVSLCCGTDDSGFPVAGLKCRF